GAVRRAALSPPYVAEINLQEGGEAGTKEESCSFFPPPAFLLERILLRRRRLSRKPRPRAEFGAPGLVLSHVARYILRMIQILKLTGAGIPQTWLSIEEAVLHYATGEVICEL